MLRIPVRETQIAHPIAMTTLRPLLTILVCAALTAPPATAQGGSRAITIPEFLGMDRVADPQISPDARWVAYAVTATSLPANARTSHVWLRSVNGGAPRRVSDAAGGHGPRWSPDGATLAYVAGGSVPQIRLYDVARRRARTLTSLATGADGIVWSPTGTHIAFVSDVYPECTDDLCNRRRLAETGARAGDVRVYDELLFRHWNRWEDGRRSHLFVVAAAGGPPLDLTPGAMFDVPVPPFGGSRDYAFSADGSSVYYTTKLGHDRAWHTNSDIYRVPVTGGPSENVTAGMTGGERHPAPSPDGRVLAFLSQARPGFESDKWRLLVRDATGRRHDLTAGFDRSVDAFAWLPSGTGLVFGAQDGHRAALYRVDLDGRVQPILRWGNTGAFSLASDGNALALVNDAMDRPGQVYVWRMGGRDEPVRLTDFNAPLLAQVRMHAAEEIQWVGAGGRTVRGMILRPPQFRAGERYPLVVLIHGGPQGAWLDNFHPRWNAQLFAAPGYVVALLNPRGSTGFGQQFVDEISQDWGGRVFTDIVAGVEHAARFRYVDSTRMAAAGGSYGGYMVNWINAHSRRFDALISHAGVFDLEAFYGATEELWFPEWEFGGPPWRNRTWYERWSPHRFADALATPTLVMHGARDYRVPDTQSFAVFTALRRQDVPARLVHFPDEGHWISRPANQNIWWAEVQAWLDRYLGQ